MENNQLNYEIERRAKEKLNMMSSQEIEKKARLEKNSIIKTRCIFLAAVIIFVLCFVIYLCAKSASDTWWLLILLAIFVLLVVLVFCIGLRKTLRTPNDEWALLRLIKELKSSGIIVPLQQSNAELNVSKSINIETNGKKICRLLFDNENKVFQLQTGETLSKLYKFTDVINYEVYENGASKVSGTAGKALIGGAFFGLGGMIIGSSMGRTLQETCFQLKLIIRLNDIYNPQMEINYINSVGYPKDSTAYQRKIENLQLVCSQLEYMINSKTLEESSKLEQPQNIAVNKDIKNQLLVLQEMLKEGLITEEEFEKKKKQILGL